MINPLSISVSGLLAASKKAANAAVNLVNASTTGSLDETSASKPYEAVDTISKSTAGNGVQAVTVPRNPAFVPGFEPDSPFADSEGMVGMPNVNLDEELVTLKTAEHAYKANAQALKAARDMQDELLDALDKKV